jgi:hypothetical protein
LASLNVKQTGVLSKRFSLCSSRGNKALTLLQKSALLALCLLSPMAVFAAETNQFLGAQSCASSSCHGGADTKSNQNLIWSQHDPHSKSFATLITARSERIAESLNITNAARSSRCTVCHAPFATVPADLAATVLDPAEGVSCESCHGMAKTWLRSHTRKDFSHADKVATGMRELRNLYARANACVACHQNVDADILAAGHPELIFELDGQSVSEHKHWQEQTNWSGAQTWLVGQLVAAREINWRVEVGHDAQQEIRAEALNWMLERLARPLSAHIPYFQRYLEISSQLRFQLWDGLGKETSAVLWTPKMTRACLVTLANTSPQFRDHAVTNAIHARRAERLVIGLDRLLIAAKVKDDKANAGVDKLFKLAQSLPDFEPTQFADALDEFAKTLKQ